MTRDDDTAFEPRVGRSRGRGDGRARRPLTFLQEVNRAVARAGGDPRRIGRSRSTPRTGRFNARGRGAKLASSFPREHGWSLTEGGMRFRARRVVVKARVVKLRGTGSKAALAHLRYLQRDGATLDGERGRLYSAFQDDADGSKFLDRGQDDRHQFRLIVAPEDGPELGDLRDVTRRLMAQMERDLETQLDWVAVDHHNTGHPHSHIVIRGMTDDGKILNIAGDYIAHGIRHRAAEIVTLELGMQSEWEVQQTLGREVEQDRFTRLDRVILDQANEQGLVDLRIGAAQSWPGQPIPVDRAAEEARYAYVGNDPLNLTDPLGLWTLQLGGNIGYTLPFGISGTFFAGIALDDRGGVAGYYGYGLGYGAGAGASIGGGAAVSNAKTVNDLGGPFVNTSVSVGSGGHVGVETFNGPSDNGFVTGVGVSGGVGLGGTSYAGPTNTVIVPLAGPAPAPQPSVPAQPAAPSAPLAIPGSGGPGGNPPQTIGVTPTQQSSLK